MSKEKAFDNTENQNSIRLTKRGRAAATIAGLGLATAAGLGLGSLTDKSAENTHEPKEKQVEVFYADHDTVQVKVRPGEGVNDVIERVYGEEAPEGVNQVVENNPAYDAQFNAIVDQNDGSDELRQGQVLHLPKDFYTEEELKEQAPN